MRNGKPLAKICFNGIKYYNADGSRNTVDPFSSRWKGDVIFLENQGYNIIYDNN